MKQRNGFSLLELMVIIGIISILSGVVAVNIPAWRANSAIKTFSRNLRSDFVLLKSEAAKTNQPHKIRFDFNDNRYEIERLDTGDIAKRVNPGRGITFLNAGTTLGVDGTGRGLVFTGRGLPLNPDMTPIAPNEQHVEFEGMNGERRRVVVSPVGRIELRRPPF